MLTERPEVCQALDRALIAHLTAVSPRGQPQSSPVWFLRVDHEIVVYNRPNSPRLASIAGNGRVSLVLRGDPEAEGAVIVEGDASVDPGMPPAHERPAYVAKYAGPIEKLGWTPESFADDFSIGMTIMPRRLRAWGVDKVIAAEPETG